jgi:hypothetical protein
MDIPTTDFVRAGSLEELKAKGRLVVHGPHRPILVVHDKGHVFAPLAKSGDKADAETLCIRAISGRRHRNKRPKHAGRKHDPEFLDGLEVKGKFEFISFPQALQWT